VAIRTAAVLWRSVARGMAVAVALDLGCGVGTAAEVARPPDSVTASSGPASTVSATTVSATTAGPDRRRSHWAFQPLQAVVPPAAAARPGGDRPSQAIDAFIAERLQSRGLPFPKSASRRALIRR